MSGEEWQAEQRAGNSNFKSGYGKIHGDDSLSAIGAGNHAGPQTSQGKNDDPPSKVVPEKEVTEMENEEKKGVNSNNEKLVCACSNSQKESNKEEEHGKEEKAQKFESEYQKVGPIIQAKDDESSYDDASASSNNKENEEDFNEAQDCNISDTEPLLLLTNGSPKQTGNMILNSQ
ncbi:uncharacterized protein LOC131857815 [Cryptomeria japonica]|uniref:uncharacterized protein LOC131857815 n=1 Tax=Cryptomeria japonica TaxID=3369 RepID=UPI0027DA0BFC|nr:uncharacterized protein LOC131857815 [Cryptomeria japonica]